MADILQPQSFATDFSTVVARAQQAAVSQSANILTAASNIARQRERAGQAAADAVFRMRLEDFQRQQFAHKTKTENARLALQQEENKRAGELHPLNVRSQELRNQLTEVAINDAPLRTAILGANLTALTQKNAAGALDLGALPEDIVTRQRLNTAQADFAETKQGLFESETANDLIEADRLNDILTTGTKVIEEINALSSTLPEGFQSSGDGLLNAFGGGGKTPGLVQAEETLKRLRRDHGSEISMDADVSKVYNEAVDRYGLDQSMKISASDDIPEGFDVTSIQQGVSSTGKPFKTTHLERRDKNAKVDSLEVRRRISILEDQAQAQTKTFERQLEVVNKDITSLERVINGDFPGETKEKAAAELVKKKRTRDDLVKDMGDVDNKLKKATETLVNQNREDLFPGGMPGVRPGGPDASLFPSREDYINSIQ